MVANADVVDADNNEDDNDHDHGADDADADAAIASDAAESYDAVPMLLMGIMTCRVSRYWWPNAWVGVWGMRVFRVGLRRVLSITVSLELCARGH